MGERVQREVSMLLARQNTGSFSHNSMIGTDQPTNVGSPNANSNSNRVRVLAAPERGFASYLGACEVAGHMTDAEMWVNKQEYSEMGCSVVWRKCL